ncbi:serine protease [Nonomuraea sp. ATR24]|uniref:trypsin-like serine peptidase n=1 Tax=Nonomuraea sp. ATR24 TaxID=1676744 RepID=UPI0035C0D081
MTLTTPVLAAAPLVAGLLGPALIGAAPEQHPGRQVAVPAAAHGDIVEHVAARGPADQRRVLDYWTPQRMSKALPISLLGLVTQGGLLGGLTDAKESGGTKGLGVTELKKDLTDLTSSSNLTGTLNGLTGGTGLGAAPQLANRSIELAPVKPRPQHQSSRPLATTSGSRWAVGGAVARTTGRVFLTMSGVDFVCSASTVRSANRDVVLTAGHCVKDGTGAWAQNWTFVPAYGTSGRKPYGQWTARRMFVAGPWSRSADDSYDVGMVALATSGGKHVADVVGTQEIAFNAKRGGHAFGFGYPADPPYDGSHLVYCAGKLRDDPYGDTHDQGLGCDMTAGSSGGPWMSGFDSATGKGTITSLSSFKYSNDQRTMYGPFLGEAARKLFLTAERA